LTVFQVTAEVRPDSLLDAVEAQQQVIRSEPTSVIRGLEEKLPMMEQVGRKSGVLRNMLT